jgi:hypothetical protein
MRSLPLPPLVAVGILLLLEAGCGSTTSLDLSLVADPNVNSEETLLGLLGSVRLVVDSPDGLYNATPRTVGDLEIVDVDGDGEGELRTVVSLGELGHLPFIRLEQGGLPDVALDLRLDGIALSGAASPIASGGVRGIRFTGGESSSLDIPFNLKPLYQPPRVTRVDPEDGAEDLSPKEVGLVYLEFPKRMNEASLKDAGVLTLELLSEGKSISVSASAIVVSFPGGSGLDSPTVVQFRLAKSLAAGSYRVGVSSSAQDASGRPLDQSPMLAGNQPFTSRFSIASDPVVPACSPDCSGSFCQSGGTACPAGLTCIAVSKTCLATSCPASCAPATVCDEALALCVPDCRLYGPAGDGCPAARPTCSSSGLCF